MRNQDLWLHVIFSNENTKVWPRFEKDTNRQIRGICWVHIEQHLHSQNNGKIDNNKLSTTQSLYNWEKGMAC